MEWTGEGIFVGGDIGGTHCGEGGGGLGVVVMLMLEILVGGILCRMSRDYFLLPPIFLSREFWYSSSWARCTQV